jgi:3-hydroxyisobutyrate dehydrogenase
MRVGFIGLGSKGGPMARRIVEGGYETTLWARRAASLEPYADMAAKTAGSPAELAAASDLVCLCVVGDDDVREVLHGETGVLAGLASGGIVAIHSTVHPDTCREIAEKAAAQGVSVIDARVSGGAPAVEEGKLLVMVGGDEDVVERCRPVFATYADPIVHLGPLGSGQVTKILNNLLFSANLGSAISTLELGESLGIPRGQLCEVLNGGSAVSKALGSMFSGEPWRGWRRSPVHCCRRMSATQRASRPMHRCPRVPCSPRPTPRCSRWITRVESGRVRRDGPHGRTHGAPPR